MFYSNEMIVDMGFADVDDFVSDYVRQHPNCCIMFVANGVLADYDFDSELGLSNAGEIRQAYPKMSIGHTDISTNTYTNRNFKIPLTKSPDPQSDAHDP